MKQKIYIETSVISYAVATLSESIRIAGHQLATLEFWNKLSDYQSFVSDTVVEEASCGDTIRASRRLEIIGTFEVLEINQHVQMVAKKLISEQAIPTKCPEDALHIACAAVNGIDFILTWNFKHINNPFMIKKISEVITKSGYVMPVICSPEEFLEAENE